MRESDLLGRLGGDEFAILLPETTPEQAEKTAERLRVAIAEATVPWEDQKLRVTVSIGLDGLTAGKTTVDHLLRMADAALYAAKSAGRNRVAVA